MDYCPTCRARYREGEVCYRCQTDLREVLAVERDATRRQRQSLAALRAGDADAAYRFAQQACGLHRSVDSVRALTLASLATRRFDEALALWREYRRGCPVEHREL